MINYFIKILLLCIVVFVCSCDMVAQTNKPLNNSTVRVPKSVKIQLTAFELGIDSMQVSSKGSVGMYVHNLGKPKELTFIPGIYTYQLLGPHFVRRVFIYHNREIYPFRSIFFNDLLEEYLAFTKSNNLPVDLRIQYLKYLSLYFEQEYNNANE